MDRTINNRFQTSPAIMNDGRSFTDYRPACYVDAMIANSNKLHGSNDYREFLIKNGLQLMKVNDKYIEDKLAHRTCNNNAQPGSAFAKVCNIDKNRMSCLDQNPQNTGIYYNNGGSVENNVDGFDQYAPYQQSLQ